MNTPAYLTKPYEQLTAEERAEFDRDADEAHYAMLAEQDEFPNGEFAPQCNIGPRF